MIVIRRLRKIIFLPCLALVCGVSNANVTAVSGSPSVSNCSMGSSQTLIVNWRVTYNETNFAASEAPSTFSLNTGSPYTIGKAVTPGPGERLISSTNSSLRAGLTGQILVQPLSELHAVGPTSGGTIVVNERILVPENVITAAQTLGFNLVRIEREFSDQQSTMMASVTCNIVGSSGTGELNVSRIGLRFPDNSRVKLMSKGELNHVLADISFTGSGRLEAVWEVADPTSTAGNPSFRILRLVRRQVVSAGQQITLRSPDIPSDMDGVYLVRFRVTSPALVFDSPVIRYFINPAQTKADLLPIISLESPAQGFAIDENTRFKWQPINGAVHYLIQLHKKYSSADLLPVPSLGSLDMIDYIGLGDGVGQVQPVAGILVDGDITEISLTPTAMSRLPGKSIYWWRIQAYDNDGVLIGQSELRPVYLNVNAKIPLRIDASGQ